jgi:membrane-bound lytic murein transglycosylase D
MSSRKWIIYSLILTTGLVSGFLISYVSAGSRQQEPITKIIVEDYIEAPEYPSDLNFAGEIIPVDMFYIRENFERELLVNTYWHSSTLLLLKRSTRWFPVIEPILKKNGIPDDFKYLCAIESNLSQAKSPAGAVGFWQILETTAKELGLEVTEDVDERYNVERSTEAACKYFLKSYQKFGNWSLVAASYNAGTKKISELIATQQASSYFDLLMPEETERYLFRILAIKLIIQDPEAYGFKLDACDYYEPLESTEVKISGQVTSWTNFAKEHGITYKLLKIYNPWLRTDKLKNLAGKSYMLRLPAGEFSKIHQQN